jgi:hypothetical protein
MIAPFAIFTTDDSGATVDRTRHYVIDGFNRLYGGALADLPSWPRWVAGVEELRAPALGAFRGEVDLHRYSDRIAALAETYEALRREAEAAHVVRGRRGEGPITRRRGSADRGGATPPAG